MQKLEGRTLLSAAAAGVAFPESFTEIAWRGETRYAKQGEWILKLDGVAGKSRAQISKVQRLLDNAGVDANVLRHLNADGTVLLRTPPDIKPPDLKSALGRIGGFRYVEPNFGFRIAGTTPNDVRYGELWALNNTGQTGGTPDADIDAPEAWDLSTGDSSVIVGVIDTGVDYTHPDLAGNIWTNPGEIAGDQIDNDGNGFVDDWRGWDFANDDNDAMDDNGHGTHVAGTIAAVGNNNLGITGVSWNAKLLPLKFTDADGFGEAAAAVAAINYVNMMAVRNVNIRVTNNSWGGFEYSAALRDAMAGGMPANVIYVAAAGNDARNNDDNPIYPAAFDLPNLITVAATDDQDRLLSVSNYGKRTVHVAAPGRDILSTVPGSGYAAATGTSYASPHVAGIAALAWGLNPAVTFDEVRDAVLQGGDAIPSLRDMTSTGRRVNALGTLMKLPMRVLTITPAPGQIVTNRPTDYFVRFSHAVTASTLQASDLRVNGIPAGSITVIDDKTATFHFTTSPVTAEGTQTIEMPTGSVTRLADGKPVSRHVSNFRYDATILRVTHSTPFTGSVAAMPFTQLDLHFSEPVDTGTIRGEDLVLSQGRAVRLDAVDADTIRFTLEGIGREGVLRYEMAAGAVTDLNGGPSRAYAGQLELDVADSFPLTLSPILPMGHGVYEARFEGAVSPVGDTDAFTVTIPAGQRLSFALDAAAESTLAPRIAVRSGGGAFLGTSGGSVGGGAALQNLASSDGTYVITVSADGGTSGAYVLRALSNSVVENEDRGNSGRNDSRDAAQNLDTVLRPFGGQVQGIAVAGRVDMPAGTLPAEQEPNNSSGTANSGRRNFISKPKDSYQLAIEGNLSTGSDQDYYKLGRLRAGDVLTVAVSGAGSSRGTLGDPFLELYSGTPSALVRVHENDDGGPHTDSLIYRYVIPAENIYYVRASGYAMDAGSYDLSVYLEEPELTPETWGAARSEAEPNDGAGSATDLSTSWQQVRHVSTTTGTLEAANDRDFYTYDFRKGDVVTIRLEAASQADARLTLSGPSGAVVASDDGTSLGLRSGAGIFAFVAPSTGRYYLEVSARSGAGAYTKHVEVSAETPPTTPTDASDYYSLTLVPGELVSVAVADQTATFVAVELYDAQGALVARGVNGAAAAFDQAISQYKVQEPGRHYVRVIGDRNAEYQLLVTRGAAFENGANNTPETAHDLGDAHAVVGHVGLTDHYRFDVNAGDTIELRTFTPATVSPVLVDPYLQLYGPDGNFIAFDTNSAGDGRNAALTHRAAVAGTYRVFVGSNVGAGPYVLQVGGNVLAGLDGTDAADTFYLRSGPGDELHVYRNVLPGAGPPTFVLSRTGTSRLRINGRGGDDLFIVDLSNGSPIPVAGAAFDGGPGNDRIRLTGTSTSHSINISGSRVQFGPSQITYSTLGSVGLDALPGDPVIDVGSLTITGSGRVALVQGSGKVLKVGSLDIQEDGVLDITDNRLIVSGDAATRDAKFRDVFDWVSQARSGPQGRWTGNGITSSLAVGTSIKGLPVVLNDNGSGGALFDDFGGAAAGVNDVLVRYTYNGDANLDGLIDADDYFRIDSGFLTPPVNPSYTNGDFNYDALIDADDYFLIDQAFLNQGAPLGTAAAAAGTASSAPMAAAPLSPATATEGVQKKRTRHVAGSVFSTVPVRSKTRQASSVRR